MELRIKVRDGESLVRVAALGPGDFPIAAEAGADGVAAARAEAGARAIVVADAEALRLHGALLDRVLPGIPRVAAPRGEAAKSLASLEALYGAFLDAGLDRGSTVIAFGGGTVSDLAGFAAATWLRGVAFECLPTTLLAMVDASVGGKTGIDFRGRKNLVGAFSQPRRVLADVAFLDTLSDTEFASGMAEVLKHAVLAGGDYAALVEGLGGRRPRAAEPGGRGNLEAIVAGSVAIKAGVVSRDEREAGERRLLNLGHSIGHGLELELGIPHGHAVAAGLCSAARLAAARGAMEAATLSRLLALVGAWDLPVSVAAAIELGARGGPGVPGDPEAALALRRRVGAALGADKKREADVVRFVLPRDFGRAEVVELPLAELAAFVMEVP
ncbi:MAG: 3-dehydroquinate synthase [Spirochaetaceae bacterium]|nr:3-dehydroquinate synthase [Spirochaetaceae bacterium]